MGQMRLRSVTVSEFLLDSASCDERLALVVHVYRSLGWPDAAVVKTETLRRGRPALRFERAPTPSVPNLPGA